MPPENEVSLRDTLENAFDSAEQAGGSPPDSTESVRATPEASAPAVTPIPAADRGDGRTQRGQFAPRKSSDVAAAPTAADAAQPAATPAPAVDGAAAPDTLKADPYAKAPQSWKPGAREAWGQLPPDVRAEVHRRERESARIVQETSQARQVASHIDTLSQKYAPALQAEGVDVIKATENLMSLASRLRFGTPIEKAHLAATIIRSYGVDINQLANVLDGQPMPQLHGQPAQPPQGMYQDPRVDTLLSELNAIKQQREQQVVEKAVGEVEQFGSTKEFFEDVREEMADLLEVASRRKIDLSLEQAYERACSMHPEISKVLAARKAAEQAGTANQSTQRARHAASSVRGTPSGVSTSQPSTLRESIEAAFETVGGR